jgi:hypothetical protein
MWHSITIEWYDFPDNIHSLSITTNLSDMYYEAIKRTWYEKEVESLWAYLNWKKLKDLEVFFDKILNELLTHPNKYKKMNPENWWWSYRWLCKNIMYLLIASREEPDLTLGDWY